MKLFEFVFEFEKSLFEFERSLFEFEVSVFEFESHYSRSRIFELNWKIKREMSGFYCTSKRIEFDNLLFEFEFSRPIRIRTAL